MILLSRDTSVTNSARAVAFPCARPRDKKVKEDQKSDVIISIGR